MNGSSRTTGRASNPPDGAVDYQSFIGGSADVSAVTTPDGIYRYVSPACLRLFGWDPPELEGRRQEDFVHPDDIRSLHSGREELAAGRVSTTTYRFLCHDGTYRWSEATSRRVNADGVDLVVSTVRDVEQRRRSDLTLQRQALAEGIDVADHGAWDEWLGNRPVPCDVRVGKRRVLAND